MIYAFRCRDCDHSYTEHRPVAERDDYSSCPECCGDGRRVVTPVPSVFKGSGFPSHDDRKRPFPLD